MNAPTALPRDRSATSHPAVTLLLDRAICSEAGRWLAVHLGAPGASAPPRVVELRNGIVGPAEGSWRRGLEAALGGAVSSWHVTKRPHDEVAPAADDGRSIVVVTDDGSGRSPGARWALRHARSAVLVLPVQAGSPVWNLAPRALAVARPTELPMVLPRLRSLPTRLPIDLRVVFEGASYAPALVLRELVGVRLGLDAVVEALRVGGRDVTGELVLGDDVPEQGYSLVVRPARRGLLGGLVPGPDARSCRRRPRPRLLLGTGSRPAPFGGRRAR